MAGRFWQRKSCKDVIQPVHGSDKRLHRVQIYLSILNKIIRFKIQSSLSTEGDALKYLRKDQGDLKRLRQELLIAWTLRKAGTHELKPHAFGRKNIFPTYKLKAKELAGILNDEYGIPCTKIDVDNAAKKMVFTPRRVPNTQEVRIKLGLLRRNLFPKLEINEFIAGGAEFLLIEDP